MNEHPLRAGVLFFLRISHFTSKFPSCHGNVFLIPPRNLFVIIDNCILVFKWLQYSHAGTFLLAVEVFMNINCVKRQVPKFLVSIEILFNIHLILAARTKAALMKAEPSIISATGELAGFPS
jgi:hypothetical protein